MTDWTAIDDLCKNSIAAYCKTFMPETFPLPFSIRLHILKLFPILDDPSIKRIVIETSRDIGKSSFMKAMILQGITYGKFKFPVYASETDKIALPYSRQIQHYLETSKRIKKRFGDLKSDRWARGAWMTNTGIFMRTLGMGQQIRSMQTEDLSGTRPDFVILDDAQDAERCMNEDQRKKDLKWFTGEFEPALAQDARLIVIGNAVHCDSLIRTLAKMKGWVSLHIPICDESLKESYWEDHHPIKKLRVKRDNLRMVGEISTFYREVLAEPMPPPEERVVRQQDIIPYTESEKQLDNLQGTFSFVIGDPAKTKKMSSAHGAALGVTVDPKQKIIFIRRMIDEKFAPNEYLENVFHAAGDIGACVVCLEKTGLSDWLEMAITTYQLEHNLFYETFLFEAGMDSKMERFKQAVPYFLYKQVKIHPDIIERFSLQILPYGHTARRDVGDCVAYIPRMMNQFGIVFEAVKREITKQDIQEEDDEYIGRLWENDDDPDKLWSDAGLVGYAA